MRDFFYIRCMQASELRIGNRILYKGKETIVNLWILQQLNEEMPFGTSDFQPIPLTTEILEKFYFANKGIDGYGSYYEKNGYCLSKYKTDYFGLFRDNPAACNSIGDLELKYVHQLQNLFFSLTGEELTVYSQNTYGENNPLGKQPYDFNQRFFDPK
jgi:hypothetical protein